MAIVFGHENDRSVQDTFMKKCKKKVQFIEEQDLWVNGCFMSEEDMRLDKFSEKKKRQILEEDESMGEEDFRKEAEGHDTMPSNMDLPEDTTDPTILIEADGTDNQHKTLKLLNFPVMDDADALASSYIPRVLTCLSKWGVKIQSMMEVLESVEDLSDNLRQ
ncbi:unnamed protein product [Durusdinium trenchii]